ncbi:MAG: hypothetical protein LBI33_13210 [Propionibacteriaceae bacterium]|jgi:hypothetical protein|nr:hypothetical protein [Propionibacteriaceae bacterium]
MSFHDIPHTDPLAIDARQFVARFADDGPHFLATHLPPRFIVGTPAGAQEMDRDRFIEAALRRATLVTGQSHPSPALVDTKTIALGDTYLLVTAHWTMPLPGVSGINLVEDFLIQRTTPEWMCLAYLLRQDLPSLLQPISSSGN